MIASTIDAAAARLGEHFGPRLARDVPLAPLTTYRVGGPAALFVDVDTPDDLAAIAAVRSDTGLRVLVVGRGSNMLVSDRGFDGLAITVTGLASAVELPNDAPAADARCVVTAGAAAALPVVARRTAAAGIRGFEWAVGVPGTIGGAVRMNAGGHGSDMASCTIDVEVFDLDARDHTPLRTVPVAELAMRYRASGLAASAVVVSARLALRWGDRERAEAEVAEIVRWRRANQPGGQNCGSVFANPVPGEVSAGILIDDLGLRGHAIGSASVSTKHANFIQAGDGGSAADVRAVMEHVRAEVERATGYRLRSEVRLVGFDDVDPSSFEEPT